MDKFQGMNQFLKEKLRAPTMTAHDAPDGGDVQLADAAQALADEATNDSYTPPMPVPIAHAVQRGDGMRESASEVWLVNPPAALPGTGVLVAGGNAEKGSQFPINSIRIDNLTRQWLYFPEVGAWVPPLWYGRVIRSTGGLIQRVRFETPAGLTAFALSTSEVARVMFSEAYWDEVDGESIPTGVVAGVLGGVSIQGDAGIAQVQSGSASAQTASLLGLLTNGRMYAFNGVTWDQVKAQGNASDGVGLYGTGVPTGIATEAYRMGYNGASWDRLRVPNIFKQVIAAIGAGSTVTVWTPAAGKKPRLMGWVVDGSSGLVDAAVTFFETSTTGTFMGETGFLAGLGAPSYVTYGEGGPIVSTSSAIIVAFSSTGLTLRGTIWGVEE